MKNTDFTELIDGFINESQVNPNTQKTYFNVLRVFYKWFTSKGMEYWQLKTSDLLIWKSSIEKTKSPLTVSTYLTIIKQFYSWIDRNDFGANIATVVKIPPKYKGFRKFPLSVSQIEKLLKAIPGDTLAGKRDFALINIMLRNGLRMIEAQRILIEDITQIGDQHVIYLQRKGKKEKADFVVLSEKGLQAIRDYLEALTPLHEKQPLFVSLSKNNFGKQMNVKSMSRIVKGYFYSIGLVDKHYTAHSLRHTAGVLAIKGNVGEYATQLYLGHATFATTQLYTRMIEREMLLKNSPALLTDNLY